MTRRLLPKLGFRDEHLRCWECPRTLGCSLLEVGPVQRCWLGFEGYQASRNSFRGDFSFPTPEHLHTLSWLHVQPSALNL